MTIESIIELGVGQVNLNPAPIRPDWVLEGNPITRNKLLSSSADGDREHADMGLHRGSIQLVLRRR